MPQGAKISEMGDRNSGHHFYCLDGGPDDLATYQRLKVYAAAHDLTVTAAAKQLLTEILKTK